MRIVMMMVLEQQTLPHKKIWLLRAQCSYTETFLSIPGSLLIGRLSQIDQILIDRRRHSSIPDVQIFWGVDCDTDHYLAVAKFRERLAVSKQAAQKLDEEGFNLRKLNKLELRKQYQTEISNRLAALENLRESKDINRAWLNIKGNIKTSAKESLGLHELKQHKPW
jgi:hypothetical protein